MLSSLSLYGIYIAKETRLALKLASAKCHIPNSVLENAREIKSGKVTKYLINFFSSKVWKFTEFDLANTCKYYFWERKQTQQKKKPPKIATKHPTTPS